MSTSKLSPESLEFKLLDAFGVTTLVDWAAAEGWNPGLQDALLFYHTDPLGFYGFYNGKELVAGGAIVSYDGLFGFMGLFIVKPEYRSSGIGRELWYHRRDMLLSRLEPGAVIGMDGVVAMQNFYHEGGFEMAFRDERYERIGEPFELHPQIRLMETSDIQDVLQFDTLCFGFPRTDFMLPWLSPENGPTYLFSDSEGLQGFAHIRPVRKGYKIGPLFANKPDVADALYRACLSYGKGSEVYLDIPVSNSDAVELVKNYRARYVFECGRMYYGGRPALPYEKIFGITTFELG